MINFVLRCIHCGRCYALTDKAQKIFLKTDDALGKFSKNMNCCDKPFYGVDLASEIIDVDELKKLLGDE